MAGTWERRGTVTVTQDSNIVTGVSTYWTDAQNGPQVGNTFYGPDGQAHEVAVIRSATELWLADDYKGATAAGVPYQIDTTRVDSVPGLASRVAAVLGFAQGQYDNLDKWTQGGVDEDVTLTSPNGESVKVPSLPKMGKDYTTVAEALPAAERAEAAANRADVTAVDVNAKHADVVAMTAQVSSMRTEVETDARQASAASDTAAQKAAAAAEHEAAALDAAERAENAALANTGTVLDGGICDLSGGVYPPPITVGGDPYSSVWYVGGAGTVSGERYDVGDVLRYSTANGGFYFRQDAKDDVYSVNGEKGEVVITPEKIRALPISGGVASGHIFVDMGTDEEDPQIGLRRGPRTILMADSGSKVGLFTNGIEGVNGAWLISRLIATGVIDVGDRRTPLALNGIDEAPLYNGGRIYCEGFKPTISDVDGLASQLAEALSRIAELETWPQSGSNANGSWIKHRDGTMTCRRTFEANTQQNGTTTQGIYYGAPLAPLPFPIPFVGIPVATVTFMPKTSGTFWAVYSSSPSTTHWPGAYPFREQPIPVAPITICLEASGRWK